jgi:hypothetical protein
VRRCDEIGDRVVSLCLLGLPDGRFLLPSSSSSSSSSSSFSSPLTPAQHDGATGASYEHELALRLRALAVPFEDEETLRARGLPKTPDARLLVPLGLVNRDGNVSGRRTLLLLLLVVVGCLPPLHPPTPHLSSHPPQQHVVNWIDSKAMYGSRETYLNEVLPQVTRYVNRFGPGCVVFWWGFDEGIRELPSMQHHHVVLLDDFPPRDAQLVFLGGAGAGAGAGPSPSASASGR